MEKNRENNDAIIRQQNWSHLRHDILGLISPKLASSFFDISSFKSVCSSWRSSLSNRTRETFPMLVLRIDNVFYLCDINKGRRYPFRKSSWFVEQCRNRSRIIGSHQDGWVILSDEYKVPYLFHMFLEIRIQLPNEDTPRDIRKAILHANDPNSHEVFIVVMSYYFDTSAFWRHGDPNLTRFGNVDFVFDIAFCNNMMYAIKGNGLLEGWDFTTRGSLPEKKLKVQLNCKYKESSIISSDNHIFVVNFDYCSSMYLIYKVEHISGRFCKVSEVDSLNGQTILSRLGDSVILSASDVQRLGYKANCIYLTEKEDGHVKLSTYCFEDSELELIENLKITNPEENQLSRPTAFWLLFTI